MSKLRTCDREIAKNCQERIATAIPYTDGCHITDCCYIRSGLARRNALARVHRGGEQIYQGRVSSLKRFQEDVTEVRTGFECGVGLEEFKEFVEGDIIEFYRKERVG